MVTASRVRLKLRALFLMEVDCDIYRKLNWYEAVMWLNSDFYLDNGLMQHKEGSVLLQYYKPC